MWSDILRRRWIVTKNHPEFWIPKITVVAGVLLCVRMAPFVCISGLLMALSMNLWEREEDYLIPRSSKERKSRRIMESIYLSTIYSFVLLVHNLIFLYVLKDDFTVENGGYLLLTNLFVWVSAIVMGISLGVINRKERKTVPQKLWHIVNNLAGGFLLGQSFDFFVLKGKLYQSFGFFFLNPDWYMATMAVAMLLEMIAAIGYCRQIGEHDYSEVLVERLGGKA